MLIGIAIGGIITYLVVKAHTVVQDRRLKAQGLKRGLVPDNG